MGLANSNTGPEAHEAALASVSTTGSLIHNQYTAVPVWPSASRQFSRVSSSVQLAVLCLIHEHSGTLARYGIHGLPSGGNAHKRLTQKRQRINLSVTTVSSRCLAGGPVSEY